MSDHKPIIIAVDGPAGSGKSTVSSTLASRLGLSYLNTGWIYRALAVLAQQQNISLESLDENIARGPLLDLVDDFADNIRWDSKEQKLWYKQVDLTPKLSSQEAASGASIVARCEKVRKILLPLQRKLALLTETGAVVEGRDIGTVVFPDAALKLFMTATLEERAKRRVKQLGTTEEDLLKVAREIAFRDEQDQKRGYAPLRRADDAYVLDTSTDTIEVIVSKIISLLEAKFNRKFV